MDNVIDHFKKNALAYTLLGIFFLLFFNLDGNRPFATPDEARYVEIPREMIASNDFITPKLNAMKYFEKPPLFYWVQAIVQKTFGASEALMRASVAFFAFVGALLTMLLANHVLGRQRSIFTGIVLSTTVLYYTLSRLIILDMPFTTFVTGAFVCFYMALHHPNRRLWFYAFSACCAFGILTKGIVILALVGPAILIWLLLMRQWIRPFYPITAILIFLAIVVPWHYFAAKANPDFLHKYFYVEHFLRYTTTIHARYKPVWFFIPILIAAVLPWLFMIANGAMTLKQENKRFFLYLVCWIGWIFFFFSFSNSKLIPYILPILPPLAILGGVGVNRWLDQADFKLDTISMITFLSIGFAGFVLPFVVPSLFIGCESIIPSVHVVGIIFMCLGLGYFLKKESITAFIHTCAAALTLLIFINLESPVIQKTSVKPLAEFIVNNKKPTDAVVSLGRYYQDLPFYTQTAPVVCVDTIDELEFGMQAEISKTKNWMLTFDEFKTKFGPRSGKAFWAIVNDQNYKKMINKLKNWHIQTIARNNELVLIYHGG